MTSDISLTDLAPILEKICGSPGFRRSPRLQRFLRFTVEHALSSSGEPLKEFQIATAVFDKEMSFDPQLDPIVRVEAGRLRLRLLEYYADLGQNDVIVIEIPKGGYAPAFRRLGTQRQAQNTKEIPPAAYRAWLKGRYLWGKRTPKELGKAGDYFRQAAAIDPDFAEAYVGLADTYLVLGTFGFIAPAEAQAKARAAAAAALDIDDTLPAAQTTLACLAAFYERQWKAAESAFRRAITSHPNYAPAHQWLGACLMISGDVDRGLRALKTARDLDPLALMIEAQLAAGLYVAGKYAQAEDACRAALELDATFWPAHYFLGLAHEQEHLSAQAISHLQLAAELSENNALAMASLGHAYASAGSGWEADRISGELMAESTQRYIPPFALALLHAAFGRSDDCFRELNKALEEHSPLLSLWLTTDPRLNSIRSDIRYTDLKNHLGAT